MAMLPNISPTPWRADVAPADGYPRIEAADGTVVAHVEVDDNPNHEGNWHMLAAAPAVASALGGLLALHEPEGRFQPSHYKPVLKKARDAMAQASGRSIPMAEFAAAHEAANRQGDAMAALLKLLKDGMWRTVATGIGDMEERTEAHEEALKLAASWGVT